MKKKRKKAFKDHRIKPGRCPLCNYRMDAATNISPGRSTRPPRKGDFTLCLRCGAILRFDKVEKAGVEYVPAVGFEIHDKLTPAARARLLHGQRLILEHQFVQRAERRS